jgi:hypothetical protein
MVMVQGKAIIFPVDDPGAGAILPDMQRYAYFVLRTVPDMHHDSFSPLGIVGGILTDNTAFECLATQRRQTAEEFRLLDGRLGAGRSQKHQQEREGHAPHV